MSTIRGFLDNLRRVKAEMIANREAEALTIALDQIALVKLRIQQRGIDSSGSPFTPYSPTYARERAQKGYQVGFVDFTRTGRMWANVQPFVVQSSVFSATVEMKGADEKTRAMLSGHENKRGNILAPSDAERALISQANRARIMRYLNQILGT